MSKGLKFLVIVCVICAFFNMMNNSDVNMANALVETGENFVNEIKYCLKDVNFGEMFNGLKSLIH